MSKRVCSIIMAFLMSFALCLSACNNNNAFFASGNAVDSDPPKVDVSNYTENEVVRGTVVFCGEASDDMWVYAVELYYIGLVENADGEFESRDIRLGTAKQQGQNIHWEIPFDTTKLPDASTIFRIRVVDNHSNAYITNLTLQLDNHGPDVLISSPTANRRQDAIDNAFLCVVVPVETASNRISQFDWKLISNDDPNVSIEGCEDLKNAPVESNKTYSFYINPFGLTACDGYEPGYFHLEIIGYSVEAGTVGELGKPSFKATRSDDLYIDFSGSVPKVILTSPSSTDADKPTLTSSAVVMSGAAVDDNGIESVELRWGRVNEEDPIDNHKMTFDTVSLTRTFAYSVPDMQDGLYWVQVRATDTMPNVSEWSEKYYFLADSNLPKIQWVSPDQGEWYNSGVIFCADCSVAGDNAVISRIMYRLPPKVSDWTDLPSDRMCDPDNESAAVSLPSNKVRTRYVLADNDDLYKTGGEYVYSIRAFKSDTEFTESTMVINLDSQKPVAAILSPQRDDSRLNQIIRINGTALDKLGESPAAEDGIIKDITADIRWGASHSVTIPSSQIVGVSNWSCDFDSWEQGIGMNGAEPVTVRFTASDYADNVTVTEVTVNIDQSTDIPTVAVNNFADGDKKYGIFTVTGTADDDDGVKSVQVFLTDNTADATADVLRDEINLLNGQKNVWANASGTTIWTYMLNLSEYPQGRYRLLYRSVDIGDKPSSYGGLYQGVRFIVDPDIPIIDFPLGTYLTKPETFSGVVTKNAVKDGDVTVAKAEYRLSSTQASGSWIRFDNMIYSDSTKLRATFSLDYNESLIAEYGQGEVTVYIRATDSSDRQNVSSGKIFVDTVSPKAALSPLANNVIRQHNITVSGGVTDEEPSSGLYSEGCSLKYSYNGTDYDETAVSGESMGGLSSFSTVWTVPANVKDGVIDIRLFAKDKAGNELSDITALQNVRLARYTPVLSNITLNGVTAADYMYVRKNVSISCSVSDNDTNDTADRGVTRISVYAIKSDDYSAYNMDSENVSRFTLIKDQTYSQTPMSVVFDADYTFAESYDYILFRAYDKAGGWSDKIYHITVDCIDPQEAFKYSSVGYLTGSEHKWSDRKKYSDTLWVKLEATDRLSDGDEWSALTGTTVSIGAGTSPDENDIAEAKIYTLGSGIAKYDLKDFTGTVYLNYTIKDKAGNETKGSISMTAGDRPALNTTIGEKWVNSSTVNSLTATTANGSVKYSVLDYDDSDGAVNNLVLDSTMFSVGSSNVIDCKKAHNNAALVSETKYSMILIATNSGDGLDSYQQRTFVYDDQAPVMSEVTVSEDLGAVYGRTDNTKKRLSGKVTFSGYFHDYTLGEQESDSDFTLEVTTDNKTVSGIVTKTDEKTEDYVKFVWTCEFDVSDLACGSKTFAVSLKDKADNTAVKNVTGYTVAPFIREIVEVSGAVKSVMRYGKAYDGAADAWCNTDYNGRYSLRRGVTSISVKGFNLSGAAYKYGGSSLSASNASATGATLTISATASSANLTATVGSIESEPKSVTVFSNYRSGTVYQSMKTGDMMLKDNDMALITYQYNTTQYTFVMRDYETAEGTFAFNSAAVTNSGDKDADKDGNYIAAGYNRFWFLNLCKDKASVSEQSTLSDNKYYMFASDTEYNNDTHAQKGVQLWGRYNGWEDLPPVKQCWQSDNWAFVKMPVNDWNVSGISNPTRYSKATIEYKNRWRMSMPNDTSNGYDGGPNNPAATGVEDGPVAIGTSNNPQGTADWSNDWGDVAAYGDKVHTVWHSLYDNKMYYRMLYNENAQSKKYPANGAVQFAFDGKYPAVTVADNNRPLIIAYDETSKKLKAFYYNADIMSISSLDTSSGWQSYEIVSGEGVGLYPRIECALNSGGTAVEGGIHIVYQDSQTGALCYAYADSISSLSSATKIVIDTDSAPGYYNDIRLNGTYITCTYIAYGRLGTGDAIRVARCNITDSTTNRANWEIITLPSDHSIINNKVRGYFASTGKMVCFGMSSESGPELFREY